MGVPDRPDHQYHHIELGTLFPGIKLPCVHDTNADLMWFPVATVCELLDLQVRPQRARIQREYPNHTDKFRLPTDGGPQELLCIEYEALALWIATVQDSKASEPAQARLKHFRALVMAGASDILLGRSTPVTFAERRRAVRVGTTTWLLESESRIANLERAVFIGEPRDEDPLISRAGHCPHCGGSIRVTGLADVTIEAIPESND